tara:strand:- start:2887 stop:3084 length:198 start_codon:yes stop_codon:yes gene_type:complete
MALDIKLANKTTEFTNSSVAKILASKAFGKDIILKNYANDTAAKAAGLGKGDIYHNAGVLRVVLT